MTCVCVIGNSHLAAIKLGWDVIKDEHPDIKPTFFGSPGKSIWDFRVEDGAIVPTTRKTLKNIKFTSGGESKITPDKFDAFLIVASGLSITAIAELYRQYRTEEHGNAWGVVQYISAECFAYAAKGIIQDSLPFEIAGNLKKLTDRPILIMPQPFPSEAIAKLPFWKTMVQHGDHISLVRSFARIISELRAAGEHVLQQPDETRSGEIFTKHEYSEGSVRLTEDYDVKHPDRDFAHMNRDYGAAVLRNIIPLI